MRVSTIDAARGKWPGILKAFKIDASYLVNKHGPCPICGGEDRWRFDDKGGDGTFFCNQCGSGNGFKLLELFTGKEFKELAREIDGMVGNIEAEPAKQSDHAANEKRIAAILRGCRHKTGIDPVRQYLRNRGLPYATAIGFNPALRDFIDGQIAVHPAMVCRITSPDGKLVGIHQTLITLDGRKADVEKPKKMLKMVPNMGGAAIRLTDVRAHIGVAEGVETALAVMRDYGVSCWATTSAQMMEAFVPPDRVEKITVFGDNDKNYRGQRAAYMLANKLSDKYDVDVLVYKKIGDFADEKH